MPTTNSCCKIEWAAEGCRARKVISRSNYRVTGKYPSWKMERMMHWESTLERDAFYLLDASPSVIEFREQPARISFHLKGNGHHHYPDLLVTSVHGSYLKEIKSDKEANENSIIERTQHLKRLLYFHGIEYSLFLESEICREPRLSNAKKLLRFGRQQISLTEQERIIRTYFKTLKCNLGEVTSHKKCDMDFSSVCRMVLEGTISIDISYPLNDEALLSLQPSKEGTTWL